MVAISRSKIFVFFVFDFFLKQKQIRGTLEDLDTDLFFNRRGAATLRPYHGYHDSNLKITGSIENDFLCVLCGSA